MFYGSYRFDNYLLDGSDGAEVNHHMCFRIPKWAVKDNPSAKRFHHACKAYDKKMYGTCVLGKLAGRRKLYCSYSWKRNRENIVNINFMISPSIDQ